MTQAGVATGARDRDLNRGVGAPEREGNQPAVGTSRLSADRGISSRSRRSPRRRQSVTLRINADKIWGVIGREGFPAGSRRPRSAVLLGAGVPSATRFCFDRSRACQSDGCETGPFLLKIGKGRALPKGRAGFTAARRRLSVEQSGDRAASP